MSHRWIAVVCAWTLVTPPLASQPALADGNPPPSAVPPMPTIPPPPITAAQLDAFAELTREPREWVWYRLLNEPALVPYAVAAADVGLARRTSGRRRVAAGFTILGVGGFLGGALFIRGLRQTSDCGDATGCHADRTTHYGLPLLVASVGIGVGIATWGMITSARTSLVEHEAMARYRAPLAPPTMPPPPPPASSAAAAPRPTPMALSLPLFSVAF